MHPALPGPIRQVGYVVRDLDAAMETWLALGIGPWVTLGPMVHEMTFRGRSAAVDFTIALAQSGDLQVELIAQHNDAPTAYTDLLDTGREGFHHLAWWTEDFDATRAALDAAGLAVVFEGDGGGTARFCYAEAPAVAARFLEVMELNEMTRGLADHVKGVAASWDGRSQPVRKLF